MESDEYPLRSEEDVEILMHRDAHFGGSFSLMIEYYEKGGKGASANIALKRIRELAQIEETTRQNLAPLTLDEPQAEKVAAARAGYRHLRSIYEERKVASPISRLIADLILSEEKEPIQEIEAVIAQGRAIVPFLIDILKSEEFYDALSPGYGQAPFLAARCLGRLGDTRAIGLLLQLIGEGDFSNEEAALHALSALGAPAREFLLRAVKSKPFSRDNERAAVALSQLPPDPEVALCCFELLCDPEVQKELSLAPYLALACEALPKSHQQKFLSLLNDAKIPNIVREEMFVVARSWRGESK